MRRDLVSDIVLEQKTRQEGFFERYTMQNTFCTCNDGIYLKTRISHMSWEASNFKIIMVLQIKTKITVVVTCLSHNKLKTNSPLHKYHMQNIIEK